MAKNLSGFAAEFAKQRAALGAGKTFTYQGKSYSTNRADDKPGMTSSPRPKPRPAAPAPAAPKAAPMPNRAAGLATPAAPKPRPAAPAASMAPATSVRPKARPAAPAAPMTSPRPKARSAEFVAANGGKRERNPNGKYSPSEEMRLRSMKDK